MINVSTQLKKESLTNRNYYVTANVTLSNGTTLKLGKKDFYLSGNNLVDSADSGDFPVGVAIAKTASLSLVNDDGRFDGYNFNAARFVIFLNVQLSDRIETIKRGTYIVSKKPATASEISLSLLDKMHNADKTYDSNLSYPCTAKELLSECCQQCGIALGDAMFPNADFQIQKAPSNATYRTVIGMCAGIAGGNARIDENDLLRIITFDKTFTNTTIYDGGAVKNWTNGDDLDGGTLNPWTMGTVIDGGTLSNNDYHALFSIQNLQYDVDDVIVTGVKYVEDETEYMSGQDGYVITIDNQLLSGNAQAGVEAIGNQLIGLRMRPFSCDGIANGYATFGDPVEFIDTKNRVFRSFVTDIEFVFGGSTSWSCSAKSAEEDVSEFVGGQQAAVEQSKKDTVKKLSAYDVKLKQMNELAANTLGFYYTEEVQADGSTISYRHDKPTLADSKVIYKTSVNGFFLSVDGGQTWKAGFDSNGDAVLNILYAIGIQSKWINTRGFTAKDNNGNATLRIDADTGAVDIVANSFSLKGKTIEDVAGAAAKSYVDSAIQDKTGNWYGNYTPTLSNQPASGWKAADYEKHNGDTFINPTTGDVYVFSTGTAGLEITFNASCKTESVNFDYVEIYYDDNGTKKALSKIGGSFGGAKVQVPSTTFWLYWRTDSSSSSFYGFKIDSIKSVVVDKSKISSTAKSLPSYSVTNVSGSNYPESPNHGNYGNNINMLWKYTGAQTSVTAQWVSVAKVDVAEIMKQLDQETIFNLLTNNGEAKGIWLKNNQLYVSFTYAQGGTLKLGGANNGNGEMQILNSSNNVIGSWSNEGLTAKNGKIAAFTINEESLEYGKSINRNFLHAKTNSAVYAGKDGIIVSDGDTSTYGPHIIQMVDGKLYASSGAYLSCGDGYNTALTSMVLYDAQGHDLMETGGNMLSFHNYINFESDCTATFYNNVSMRGDLDVRGSKNRRVDTKNYGERLQYCYETATPYFGDMGHGTTDENGICLIEIDDIFQETVGAQEYLVFIQPEGEGNLYVNRTEKFCNYFIVRGTVNLSFAWEIKCIQRGCGHERLESPETKNMLYVTNEDEKETRKILEQSIENIVNETEELLWKSTDLQE